MNPVSASQNAIPIHLDQQDPSPTAPSSNTQNRNDIFASGLKDNKQPTNRRQFPLLVDNTKSSRTPPPSHPSLQCSPNGNLRARSRRSGFSAVSPPPVEKKGTNRARKTRVRWGSAPAIAQRIEEKLWKYSAAYSANWKWRLSPEIVSWLLSAICMAAIVGILVKFKNNTTTELPLRLTLNRYLSALSKVASIALLLPVYEALGQLEWSNGWFRTKKSQRVWDFEMFDNASRRPWSSLLFARIKEKLLAVLCAAMTVLCFEKAIIYSIIWRPRGGPGFTFAPRAVFGVPRQPCFDDGSTSFYFGKEIRAELPLACTIMQSTMSNPEIVKGLVYGKGSSVDVRWQWLVPPLILLGLTLIFLVATVTRSPTEHVGVWKTSAISTHLYDLADQVQKIILAAEDTRTPGVEAKKLKVKLSSGEEWRLSGKQNIPQAVENERGDEDEAGVATSVDNIYPDDVVAFPEFLVNSSAFQTFRIEVEKIALRRLSRTPMNGVLTSVQNKTAVIVGRILQSSKRFLVVTGYMEPPLEPGLLRLRWECKCGENFTADAREYEAGGASELTAFVEALIGNRVTATPHSSKNANQKLIRPRPGLWLQRVFTRLATTLRRLPSQSTLPQHNRSTTATRSLQGMPSEPPKLLHLLACMYNAKLGKSLHQDCIDTIDTDRKLFCFLRQLFRNHRGRFCTLLSLKKVKGISFVKLNLFAGGSVEVRHHSHCCERTCECIPPQSRVEPSDQAEYRCKPAGPLKGGPPVLPDILEHFFAKPSCIPEHNISILNRLPKRICGELQGSVEEPAEGWGIYFQEGWDGDIITMLVFAMFLIGSLLFGILWSCLKMDIQGAFGVSAYIITANAIFISLVAMRAGKV